VFTYLEEILESFRKCFSHYRAYSWFVVLVVGFMFRDDTLGVTSVIRTLLLDPGCYEPMLHFFYSRAWDLDYLRENWFSKVASSGLIQQVDEKYVLAGDGVKTSKEAYRMPGVKKLFQESEDSSKGEYIFGHMFGAVGAIIARGTDAFCIPLRMSIQEGLGAAASWEGSTIPAESHVQQIIRNGFQVVDKIGSCILVLDRLFLTTQAIRLQGELSSTRNDRQLEIVTKARRNCTAYTKPPARQKGTRGAPRKKGDPVHLWELFADTSAFMTASANVYGDTKQVQYLRMDLLWGQKLYRELQFVLVVYDNTKSILVSTDLSLTPVQIIELYSRRFRIENCFREFKQQVGGFGYHFWTLALGKLNHFKKKEEPDQLSKVESNEDRNKILVKIRAIECFVQLCCISMGLLQLLSFHEADIHEMESARYLRTKRRDTLSEASVIYYLRRHFFTVMVTHPDSAITRIIVKAQNWTKSTDDAA
jgi:hypothetical protein